MIEQRWVKFNGENSSNNTVWVKAGPEYYRLQYRYKKNKITNHGEAMCIDEFWSDWQDVEIGVEDERY